MSIPGAPLTYMADGTIKQLNPFSGTEVWSVPGRGNRPLSTPPASRRPLQPVSPENYCAFCEDRMLQTPPEKSRVVLENGNFDLVGAVTPEHLHDTRAEFRRVPNLFEIVSYDYWRQNYGHVIDPGTREAMARYLAAPGGADHVEAIVDTRIKAAGTDPDEAGRQILRESYFAGGHDVLIARRHFVDGAEFDDQLASSGTLSIEEHRAFIRLAVESTRDLYERNPYVRYVSVFQNWLSAAGASFDHLHKQLVAIDARGASADEEIARLRHNPNMYNEWGVNYAGYHNLIIAENDHAVLVVGIGHRYPTLSIYSTSASCRPWEHTSAEIDAMSDLLHAAHAAAGPSVPCNEEWHHQPPDVDVAMPWRVNIKWRVSTLAGFEGGTKIYVNTRTPEQTRDLVVSALYELRRQGRIDTNIRIATECSTAPNRLRYTLRNP